MYELFISMFILLLAVSIAAVRIEILYYLKILYYK